MQKKLTFIFHPLGDQAVVIELGKDINEETQRKVQLVTSFLDRNMESWIIEYIPAFTTVTVFYDPVEVISKFRGISKLPYDIVCIQLKKLLEKMSSSEVTLQRTVEIPVCYGGEMGPDLPFVAKHNGLSEEEMIRIHSAGDYTVFMIGFAPGFPFIGGMSEKIATPRRDSPRLKIPPRTVGIAGKQTGVYPIETPGGWQLIGRTPVELFRPEDEPPTLLRAGDKIKFIPISIEEYKRLGGD
ncbi:5-oxoprolinase subunit PxpB [Neobacillus notoginsengisoli]|uniref:5-oxoprolinase subunit PxpB n=1 Tax=Neobacillus notoginsengisoli TaxID=1578198 RepID=A0A417YRQ4_9BACI|nr:5-oxoprolinase subunit PxpB [Neobacillus notoginsengisoli]RHW37988.1 5-oxoprolinase subunit PxpB [Neobacillus notoginsengisoli]